MSFNTSFELRRYDFNDNLFSEFQNLHYAKDLWPIVYIISDGTIKEAYIGETTDAYARMGSHLKNNAKNKLTQVHLITSEKFNKSATLDIESNLIKYISGDGQYKLINANIGIANHNYYQKKDLYWYIFVSIWDKLRAEGITKHSIGFIDNSDLFKYSPYKSLTVEQTQVLLVIIKNLLRSDVKTTIAEGGAGTGKTILAIFLFKLLHSNLEDFNLNEFGDDKTEFISLIKELKKKYQNPKMVLIVPMTSFRNTLKKVFKNVKGLNTKMIMGPSEIVKDKYDIVVVDESHRLRRRINLTNYRSFDIVCNQLGFDKTNCNELDWVTKQSQHLLLFYDENQSIKPSDVEKANFDKLKSLASTVVVKLQSQFRVRGGNDYVEYINKLLSCSWSANNTMFSSKEYEFIMFDSIERLVKEIKSRNGESGLARLIAGYSWEWVSKEDKKKVDIRIENIELMWNSDNDDWINSDNSVNEVGCIHTTQGYDLNYAGIIFGNEITYNKFTNEIVIIKENYFDKNGKNTITNPDALKTFIVNIYKTIMLRAIKGTYVYVCDKSLREYFAKHIPIFKTGKTVNILSKSSVIPFENAIPIYDLKVAAGNFSDLQIVNENINDFEWVEIPSRYKPIKDFFACTVIGESMNKIIPNGSICLFRRYSGGSRNGKIVLVEHTSIQDPDFGSGYTIKEYHSQKKNENDQWEHKSISLRPLSDNSEYKDIEILEDESTSLKVIGIFEMVL